MKKVFYLLAFMLVTVLAANCSKDENNGDSGNNNGWNDDGGNNNGGTTTLSAPSNVNVSQDGTTISISWSSVSGATKYEVYRSSSASGYYSLLTSTSGSTSATDNSPISGYNYYKVKAGNSSTTSDYSSYASCNYTSGGGNNGGNDNGGGNTVTKPSAPTIYSAVNDGSTTYPSIRISWSSVSGATSYKVYRSTSASGTYSQIGSATSSTSAYDNSPKVGDNYYKVKAVNSAGESDYSSYTLFTYDNTVSPCPVTYGSCTVSGTTITMRWTVPTSSGCGAPTKTYLRVKNPTSTQYADVETLSGTATSTSFNYGMWVDSNGYVYVGIITENSKGTSGGVPKVYDTKVKKWIN